MNNPCSWDKYFGKLKPEIAGNALLGLSQIGNFFLGGGNPPAPLVVFSASHQMLASSCACLTIPVTERHCLKGLMKNIRTAYALLQYWPGQVNTKTKSNLGCLFQFLHYGGPLQWPIPGKYFKSSRLWCHLWIFHCYRDPHFFLTRGPKFLSVALKICVDFIVFN